MNFPRFTHSVCRLFLFVTRVIVQCTWVDLGMLFMCLKEECKKCIVIVIVTFRICYAFSNSQGRWYCMEYVADARCQARWDGPRKGPGSFCGLQSTVKFPRHHRISYHCPCNIKRYLFRISLQERIRFCLKCVK